MSHTVSFVLQHVVFKQNKTNNPNKKCFYFFYNIIPAQYTIPEMVIAFIAIEKIGEDVNNAYHSDFCGKCTTLI